MSKSWNILPKLDGSQNAIRDLWLRLAKVPFGAKLFSLALGRTIPYTGSIGAEVLTLEPRLARVQMKDRRRVRNHLRSIHAVALANLAEFTGNLALAYSMPDGARFIVKSMTISYLKKARGTITAECNGPEVPDNAKRDYDVHVSLTDASGSEVANATLKTLIGPTK